MPSANCAHSNDKRQPSISVAFLILNLFIYSLW